MKKISDSKVQEIARLVNVSVNVVEDWLYNDWDNGDEHEDWIHTASAQEIADWIETCIEAQ
jgi:hypothetical protein